MAVTVSMILRRARRLLFDTDGMRWPDTEMLEFINDAQRQIVFLRPEAYAVTGVITAAVGTRQTIPAGGVRLLRVTRNMNQVGNTTGKAIREANRLALDSELPGWHAMPGQVEVSHFAFDQVNPRTFYVYPPAASGCRIEAIYSATPPELVGSYSASGFLSNANSLTLAVGDQYINPVLDWVLHRAFSKDAEYGGDPQRAMHYLREFGNALDVAINVDAIASFPGGATATRMQAMGER